MPARRSPEIPAIHWPDPSRDDEGQICPATEGAASPGLPRFVHLYADPKDANRLLLLERWESRAKYEEYREWAMAQPGSSEAMAYLERDPVWTYLDDTGA